MVSVYAGDTVSKGSDAVFDPRAGCEPLRSPLLPRADVPLRGARAKNRGPLQAVPVMARAMAERLGYVVPCQSKPLGATVTRNAVDDPEVFPIEPAEGLLLQAASNHSSQQVLAQTRRRRSSEPHPPAPPKGIKRKCRDAGDLSLDRGRVCPVLPHGYALG